MSAQAQSHVQDDWRRSLANWALEDGHGVAAISRLSLLLNAPSEVNKIIAVLKTLRGNVHVLYASGSQSSVKVTEAVEASFDEVRGMVDGYLERETQQRLVVFVNMLDHCPASLAVLLVSLACLMRNKGRNGVRVVALGASSIPPHVEHLFRPVAGDIRVHSHEDTGFAWERSNFDSGTPRTMVDIVAERVKSAASCAQVGDKRKHVLLCFYCSEMLTNALENVLDSVDVITPVRVPTDADRTCEEILDHDIGFCTGRIVLVLLEPRLEPRWKPTGLASLHIMLPRTRPRLVFDVTTTQPATCFTRLPRSEVLQLMMWTEMTELPADCIFTYDCDLEPCESLAAYLKELDPTPHLEAASSQMHGFVAAVAGYQSFYPNIKRAIEPFTTRPFNPESLKEVVRQLDLQGILRFEGEMLRPLLSRHDWLKFQQVLIAVGYDVRLASFVVRGDRSNLVVHVKAQLAALLVIGLNRVVLPMSDGAATSKRGSMPQTAKDYGVPWTQLDLWQAWLAMTPRHGSFGEFFNQKGALNDRLSQFWPIGETWMVDQHNGYQAMQCLDRILEALGRRERSTDRAWLIETTEVEEVLADLFASFICQLVFGNQADGIGEAHDYLGQYMWGCDPDQLAEHKYRDKRLFFDKAMAGVFFSGDRTRTPAILNEWIWIPANVVEDWAVEHMERNLVKVLRSGYPLTVDCVHERARKTRSAREPEA